ncbi:MAG: hypothetical protein PHV82_00425 [Victivallaceae bacterium]|nr:hypothetical protein [Victivallaceae bacterium]
MDTILSISDWGDFLLSRLLLDAVFVVVAILLIFAFFNRREYENTPMFRFFLTALTVTLLSRYAYFVISEAKINSRYLFPAAFYVLILCVPGFPVIVKLGNYLLKFIPGGKEKILAVLLVLGIGIACIGKALHNPEKKEYIHRVAQILKASSSPVLISDMGDSVRIAWHSDSELIPLSSVLNTQYPVFAGNALKRLKAQPGNLFLFVRFKDTEFRKIFTDRKLEFPKEFILLEEFNERHKRFYSLYKISFEH